MVAKEQKEAAETLCGHISDDSAVEASTTTMNRSVLRRWWNLITGGVRLSEYLKFKTNSTVMNDFSQSEDNRGELSLDSILVEGVRLLRVSELNGYLRNYMKGLGEFCLRKKWLLN